MLKAYKPKNKKELAHLVNQLDDLSLIDTSLINDMSYLFSKSKRKDFTGIETWNTSKVKYMMFMFQDSKFNHDISAWDTSKVKDMTGMFINTPFNKDISSWNVSKTKEMQFLFAGSKFNKDIKSWNIRNVKDAYFMFWESKFKQDLSILAKQNSIFADRDYLGLGD